MLMGSQSNKPTSRPSFENFFLEALGHKNWHFFKKCMIFGPSTLLEKIFQMKPWGLDVDLLD